MAKRAPSPTLADLGLADHPCIRQIVIGPDRTECLLIRTSKRSLTLRLTGHRATSAPVCLTFHVPARSMVREAAASLASFPDLLRRTPRWIKRTTRQLLVRDALIAVDGRDAGASHREVAEVSVGRKRVREEWSARGGQQARYEAAHARRQYDAVDPANRLVAGELERRWNAALENVQRMEREMAASAALRSPPLGEHQKQLLMALGADLDRAWSHPVATAATRKRIMRACLDEIVVRKDGEVLDMVLRWHGGDHTSLKLRVKLNASGRSYSLVTDDLIALVRELARLMPDRQIARLLNRTGTQMATGKAWTEQSVQGFRKHRDIAAYRDGEWAERGEITLEAAAKIIGVCKMTALRMLRRGDIKGRQVCPGAPWVIKAADLASFSRQQHSRGPVTPNGAQRVLDFQ